MRKVDVLQACDACWASLGFTRCALCGVEQRAEAGYGAVMATVLLFHHAQGQTAGFLTFADDLRAAGHTVHAPDLYDGRTFDDLREGVAHAEQVGFTEIIRRGSDAARDLPADIVYAGFSLGVLPAQALAQTRPGARGAVLFHACVSPSEFGTAWPEAVPLQIHMMDADEWTEVDRPVAEALVEKSPTAELFLYRGSAHLFADPSLSDYDEQAAALLEERALAFLHRVGQTLSTGLS
jgi:dienelactone hydrolase